MSRSPVTIRMDRVEFQLQASFRLDWLEKLGTVFAVFAEQDSGNIGFGVQTGGVNYFVKVAGCRTMNYAGDPQEAIERLKRAAVVYEKLEHPALVRMLRHFPVDGGYATVYEWFDGDCLHPHWSFPPPAKYEHPDSPFYRFRQLPVGRRLAALDALFAFHVEVEARGYVAVDFYDGSMLYDFDTHTMRICDIDFYRPSPSTNDMGEMWGSGRFQSPEESVIGAPIDGITNVFTMGATAFVLLGGERDRSIERWEAGPALYAVACRAVEPERDRRYGSVAAFKQAWDAAVRQAGC